MSQFCRKQYNSEYYLRNKERIKQRRRTLRSQRNNLNSNQVQLSLIEIQHQNQKSQPRIQLFKLESLGLLVQSLLIGGITYFLLSEAVEFYRSNHSTLKQSLSSAVLVESLLIVFAFLQPSKLTSQILVKAVLISLFIYSSWSFSSNVVGEGMGVMAQAEVLDKSISGLEATIEKNDRAISLFMEKSWLSAARKLTNENTNLRKRLLDLEAQKMSFSARPEEAQTSNTISLVILRLLFQLSNIILVHQLSRAIQKGIKNRNRPQAFQGGLRGVFSSGNL